MRRPINLLLTIFVSPEVLVVAGVVAMYHLSPQSLIGLGSRIQSDTELTKFLPALTLALAGAAFKLSSRLRAPLGDKLDKLLYDWPLYPLLVDRVMVSLGFATASGVAAVLVWVFGNAYSPELVGGAFLAATFVAGAIAFTMHLTHQKLRELLVRLAPREGP